MYHNDVIKLRKFTVLPFQTNNWKIITEAIFSDNDCKLIHNGLLYGVKYSSS